MLVEVRVLEDGRVQLDLGSDNEAERAQLQHFVELLEGRAVSRSREIDKSLRPLRLVRVGFTQGETLAALRFETPT